jgi:hypothetical protein
MVLIIHWNEIESIQCCKMLLLGQGVFKREPIICKGQCNELQQRLSLTGTQNNYFSLLPKVMKWDNSAKDGAGTVTRDVITFVDDVRIVGHSKSNCHKVHR